MASSSTSKSSSSLPCLVFLILFFAAGQVESRPPPLRSDGQILRDLFGTKISALLQARPEVTEGSAYSPTLSPNGGHGPSQSVVPQHPVPHHFLKFLSHQTKFNGRSRKSSARGCFGLKMDRIGIMSGLGC
ncbi:C-type natriuretic peptide 2 [Clupea harengus]|uniref:C-type natriuretic peptide 2 n=1 Tax=Clupea harengus TaxID=7950 RepID=A0A6P8H0A0_CLUHA|nr:C-type natriuretic peptide 2 [Clupea harengus]